MSYQTIRLEEDARGIATLSLARPEKHNALSAEMMTELTDAAGVIAKSASMRAVILSAEGTSFCAGGDLNWMRVQADKPQAERVREGMRLATMLQALDDLPKPLIGKVAGNAFGGGIGMMCVCDMVVAADHAKFGLTETRLGLIPATIGPYVVRRLGEGASRRLFMNSKIFGADLALAVGLVAMVATTEALDGIVAREAEAFLSCAPGAVADAKAFAKYLARTPGDPTDYTTARLAERWVSAESAEGIAAFFEKRKARWVVE